MKCNFLLISEIPSSLHDAVTCCTFDNLTNFWFTEEQSSLNYMKKSWQFGWYFLICSQEVLIWIILRFAVNFVITFGFFGFWHCVLYLVGLSERPFNPNRHYRINKVIHNMWYSFLGVVQVQVNYILQSQRHLNPSYIIFQMTIWEAIFMHCYATKRLPFMTDQQAFSSNSWNFTMFIFACFWVPLYREIHFYFAHRYFIVSKNSLNII